MVECPPYMLASYCVLDSPNTDDRKRVLQKRHILHVY